MYMLGLQTLPDNQRLSIQLSKQCKARRESSFVKQKPCVSAGQWDALSLIGLGSWLVTVRLAEFRVHLNLKNRSQRCSRCIFIGVWYLGSHACKLSAPPSFIWWDVGFEFEASRAWHEREGSSIWDVVGGQAY